MKRLKKITTAILAFLIFANTFLLSEKVFAIVLILKTQSKKHLRNMKPSFIQTGIIPKAM